MDTTVQRLHASTLRSASDQRSGGRVPALDAVRGLAILAVTLFRFNIGPEHDTTIGRALSSMLMCGVRGVDLFFVLSGFLITGILHDAKALPGFFRTFYTRRFLRIFPLYYFTLLVLLVVLPTFMSAMSASSLAGHEHPAWLWLYGVNILQSYRGEWCFGRLDHFWSLAVEEHFYLVWPFVIFFLSRASAMKVCWSLIALALLGRVAWIASGGSDVPLEVFTLFRMDALALGALLALAMRGPRGIVPLARWAKWTFLFLAPPLVVLMLLEKRWLTLPDTLIALACACMLVLALAARPQSTWGRFWNSKVLRFLGKYSYAMYVFQNPLIALLSPVLTSESMVVRCGDVFWGRLIYMIVMTAATIVAAVMSWHLLEKHFVRLKDRWTVGNVA